MYVIVSATSVYHYGTLGGGLFAMSTSWHYEADTLSVSLCPSEWYRLSPNDAPDVELWRLFRRDGLPAVFVDLARLSPSNRMEIDRWSQDCGFGTLEAPDFEAMSAAYGRPVPIYMSDLPLLLFWAKSRGLDGIWFTEIISGDMPATSRGGIFQERLHLFDKEALGRHGQVAWPAAELPNIELRVL